MKRILYVSDAQSIHTRRWAEHYRDAGVDVHIASFRDYALPGITVHRLPTGGLGRLGYFLAVPVLRNLARTLLPDVVHAQYVTSYGFLTALAGLHPMVLTAWGTDVLISPRESRLMRGLATYAVRRADALTTVAEHMNAAMVALGARAEAVQAMPFGVDTQRFVPPPQPRLEGARLRLICTRNFGPIYDVGTLIEALGRLASGGVRFDVDLVGAGPLRDSIEKQVDALGLRQDVSFHGHVDHPTLAALLARAHLFVTPALSDGNNVSLNEAMACSSFPIATNIPANAQWIEDGINGLLYPPGDPEALAAALSRAAADKAWRDRAGRMNRQIVEQRADWRICVARMDALYERLIEAPTRTGRGQA